MQRSGRRPPLAFARTQNAMAATVQIAKTIHHASKTDLDRRLVELANAKKLDVSIHRKKLGDATGARKAWPTLIPRPATPFFI